MQSRSKAELATGQVSLSLAPLTLLFSVSNSGRPFVIAKLCYSLKNDGAHDDLRVVVGSYSICCLSFAFLSSLEVRITTGERRTNTIAKHAAKTPHLPWIPGGVSGMRNTDTADNVAATTAIAPREPATSRTRRRDIIPLLSENGRQAVSETVQIL